MGLRGSLRDFGIAEILQLIGLQRRSGKLTVKSSDAEYSILFSAGKIVKVEKTPELEEESFQHYLLRAKAATPEQIRYASQKAQAELKPLEVALHDASAISIADLKTFLGLRNIDLLNNLFLLKDGEYEFEQEPVSFHPSFAAELDTEQVLMDGYRVKDEWPSVMAELGSAQTMFRRKAGEFGLEDRLDPIEDKVYRLIDGEKDVKLLSSQARLSQFDTLKILAELKRKGRIAAEAAKKEKAGWGRKLSLKAVVRVVSWILIAGAAGLALNGLWGYARQGKTAAGAAYDQSWDEERVRAALEVYYLDQGLWPERLEELVNKGFLPASDLKFLKNSQYYIKEGGYIFSGPGP